MKPTLWDKALDAIGLKRKEANIYPTIAGGPDILANLNVLSGTWSDSKRMTAYGKSLYVYACVSKIGQKVASTDFVLYRITNSAGDKVEVFVHPALDLLYKPNPFQTKDEFFQRYIINKKLAGETFVLKVRAGADGTGDVVELWNLRPDKMRIIFSKEEIIKAYEFQGPDGPIVFKPEDIIHDSYPDPLADFGGLSPLQPAQTRVDTEEFATKYQSNFFINNARPDFILQTDKRLAPEQKEEMKEAWDKRHKGGKNAGKGAILEGGLTYQQVSISQREMDYIESLKMTRDDILTAFGVPKPVVAITEDVNYANAKTAMEIFLSEVIVPELRQMTTKLNEELIYSEYGDNFYIDYENPVPDDELSKAAVHTARIAAGTMLINEAREEFGDEPVNGGWNLYLPIGMQSVGGLPQNVNNGKRRMADTRQRVFRGRGKARKMLEIKEQVKEDILKTIVEDVKEEAKPKKTPYIPADIRKAYGDMVLKAIDERGEGMQEPLNKFFAEQKSRFMKAVHLGSKDLKINESNWREQANKWADKEVTLTAEFTLPFLRDFVLEAGQQAMDQVAPAETFDEKQARIASYIKKRSKQAGQAITDSTLEYLSSELAEGIAEGEGAAELTARVATVYDYFPQFRSAMIARTEATSANNKGFVEAYHQSGVANAKEWIATSDSRTRDSHLALDGEIVMLDEDFSNGLDHPGAWGGPPEEVVNCRCVIGPAFSE